jgi:UDP-glucose 4-epimerase
LKVVVTGGSGFIGSHVVDKVAAAGHEPRILDLAPSPWHADGEVDTAIADLTDRAAVADAVRGSDAIVHLAAMADVNEVVGQPGRTDAVNTRGTFNLLEAARAEGVSRFLYASTIWVYGNAPGPEPHDEDTPLVLPPHLYTATKLAGEMYCRSFETMYGVSTTILRFGIPYGPRARPAAVVPAFIAKAKAGTPLTIAGDGSATRQFVYVEDLAEGVVAALDPAGAGRVYNLVGDELVSVRQIADTVRELVAEVPVEQVPDRPVDLKFGQASGRRAKDELGWEARTSFAEGVRRYVDWLGVTSGSPVASAASSTAGSAATV